MRLVQGFSVTEPQATLVIRPDDGDLNLYLVTSDGREVPLMWFEISAGKVKAALFSIGEEDTDLVHTNEDDELEIY